MKLIKEELDTLQKKYKELNRVEFIKFVYATHPPKNEQHKLEEVV